MDETDKRLAVIPKFLAECDTSLFEAILLTGSMVFGKHYSVHKNSDIDVICVTQSKTAAKLVGDPLFKNANLNRDLVDAFEQGRIDRFWLDYILDDVKVNIGVWDSQFLDKFFSLQADKHVLGSTNSEVQTIESIDANGKRFDYVPTVKGYESIYVKTFPLKHDGVPVSSPTYRNLFACETLYDPGDVYGNKIKSLIASLNTLYGTDWHQSFMDYIVAKCSPEYAKTLAEHLAAR